MARCTKSNLASASMSPIGKGMRKRRNVAWVAASSRRFVVHPVLGHGAVPLARVGGVAGGRADRSGADELPQPVEIGQLLHGVVPVGRGEAEDDRLQRDQRRGVEGDLVGASAPGQKHDRGLPR
jgi:hypothetical protein